MGWWLLRRGDRWYSSLPHMKWMNEPVNELLSNPVTLQMRRERHEQVQSCLAVNRNPRGQFLLSSSPRFLPCPTSPHQSPLPRHRTETGWLSQFPAASMCDVTRSSVGGIPRWGCSPRGEAGVGVPLWQPQDKAQSWGSEGDNRLWLRLYMLGEFRAVQWPTPVFLGFPCDSAGKESACNVGDLGSIPGLGRSTGEGNSYPTQYSSLQNYTDWTVHGVAKSRTWLSDFHFTSVVRTHAFTAAEGASSNPGPGKMSSMTTHKKRHALHSQGSSPSSAPY